MTIKPNKAKMNEMDYGLKKINKKDYGLKRLNAMNYGLKEVNDNVAKAEVI